MEKKTKLYVALIVQLEQDIWLKVDHDQPVGSQTSIKHEKRKHNVLCRLYSSTDHDAAYNKALYIVQGSDDENHDGPGDIKRYSGLGIHQLSEVKVQPEKLEEKLDDYYGARVGVVTFGEMGKGDDIPIIREKHELDIFKPRERYQPTFKPYNED